MPYTNALLGALPNWCALPGVSITAGSEAPGTPAANLLLTADAELGARWRSVGTSPVVDTFLQIDLGQPRPVSSGYLVRHAHHPGDTWRLRGAEAPIPTPAPVAPTLATPQAGTVAGDHTAIDDPVDTPTGDALSLTGPAKVRVEFPSPGTLAGGPASQLLRLRLLAREATATTPKPWAVAVVVQIEQGPAAAVVEEIAAGQIVAGDETVVDLPFDAALPPAGPLRVEVEGLGTGALEIVAAEWRPETNTDATPADTGWNHLVVEPRFGARYLEAHPLAEEQLSLTTAAHFLGPAGPAEHTHQHWRLDLRTPAHPLGYATAAAVALGPALVVDATEALRVRVVDHSVTVVGPNGDRYTRVRGTRTHATVPIELRSAEGPRDLLALRRLVGEGGRFGVSLLPEEQGAPALNFWGHLVGGGGLDHQAGQFHDDDRGFHWLDTLELREV